MSIDVSSIHAALGASEPLSLRLIQQAVDERVPEDEQLDWKRALPDDGDEFAKDVAAMANSRGGLLVYGIAEDRATGRAARSIHVSLADSQQRRLRSLLGTRVSPLVAGIEVVPFPLDDDDSTGFLVVAVPESSDAPHIVGKDNALSAPYRQGTQTFWMREWDLEAAYQRRFARRAADEEQLAKLIDHLGDHVDIDSGCWIVGATRPTITAPSTSSPPTLDGARATIQRALEIGAEIARRGDGRAEVIRALDQAALNPRVGLRRWVARTRIDQSPASLSEQVHLELHHDGSTVLATRLEGWYREYIEGKHCVPDFMVTGFSADLVAAATAMAQAFGFKGETVARIELLRSDSYPYAFLAPERIGGTVIAGLTQPSWTHDVRRFLPVDLALPYTVEPSRLRDAAERIAGDVVAQFGCDPSFLRW